MTLTHKHHRKSLLLCICNKFDYYFVYVEYLLLTNIIITSINENKINTKNRKSCLQVLIFDLELLLVN